MARRIQKTEKAQPMVAWADAAARWTSPVVARQAIEEFTGGTISRKTLSNYDGLKKGPGGKSYAGKRAVYPVDSIVQWLEEYFPIKSEFA